MDSEFLSLLVKQFFVGLQAAKYSCKRLVCKPGIYLLRALDLVSVFKNGLELRCLKRLKR